jgi:hypothetical protein
LLLCFIGNIFWVFLMLDFRVTWSIPYTSQLKYIPGTVSHMDADDAQSVFGL